MDISRGYCGEMLGSEPESGGSGTQGFAAFTFVVVRMSCDHEPMEPRTMVDGLRCFTSNVSNTILRTYNVLFIYDIHTRYRFG